MANFVYIAASLDGYIATAEGGIDWLEQAPNPDGGDFGFFDFLSRVDGVLMGRITFEKVLAFPSWPYPIPVFVVSNTLKDIAPTMADKVRLVTGSPIEIVSHLREQGLENLYIDGGKTIQSFLKEDLIDELIVTRFPLLLGKGIPLFGDLREMLHFSHVETTVLENYLVKSRYRRIRNERENITGAGNSDASSAAPSPDSSLKK